MKKSKNSPLWGFITWGNLPFLKEHKIIFSWWNIHIGVRQFLKVFHIAIWKNFKSPQKLVPECKDFFIRAEQEPQ